MLALLPAPSAASAPEDGPSGPFPVAGLRVGPERIADAELPPAPIGEPYAYQFKSDLGPDASITHCSELPAGLSISSDGLLSGVPTALGPFYFYVVTSAEGSEGTEQRVLIDVVAAPSATTQPANAHSPTKAVLNGWVDSGNLAGQAWFEYWPADSAAVVKTPFQPFDRDLKPTEIEAKLEGLAPAVEYQFRLAAKTAFGPDPVYSATRTLKTSLPPPEAGKSFNIEPVDGTITTKCEGEDDFSKLMRPKQVTLDCEIDAVDGTVSVTASKGSSGETQTANFWGGLFSVFQEEGDDREAVLSLAGKRRCERRSKSAGRAGRIQPLGSKSGAGRKLWGSGSGNYKTVGSHGAATVRGTIWLVSDRCDGSTLFKVRQGTVVVRDFVKKSSVVLEAGQSYVAKVAIGRLP